MCLGFGWEWLQIPRLQKCGPPEKRGSAIISIKTKNINNYKKEKKVSTPCK
jgi:hypothetical protein